MLNNGMEKKSLTKNFIYNYIRTFCNIAFPLITFMYTSRILGAEGIGKFNFSKSFITYFAMIAMLGINQYGTREAAKLRDSREKLSKFTHEVLIINSITTIGAFLLLFASIYIVPKLHDYTSLLLVNSITIFMQGLGMDWLYQAEEEYEYITKRAILFQIIALIALLIFVKDSDDLIVYSFINVISTSGSYVLNFYYSKQYVDWKFLGEYELKKHLPGMLWLFAMAVSIELYTVLDTTMLGFISGDRAVGLYTAAVRVNKLTNSLITALGVVLVPRLSYYVGKKETDKMRDLVCKGYNYVFLMSIPSAIGLLCLSKDIISILSGVEYAQATFAMRIMTPIVILIPFSAMTNQQTLVPLGMEKRILISTCVGAVTNFITNSLLIPRFAQNGAAVGTVIAETAVAAVCLINAKRLLDIETIFKLHYQYWIAASPILPITYFVKKIPVHSIIQMGISIVLSCMVYSVILYSFRNEYFMAIVDKLFCKVNGLKFKKNE